jgi:hypothetical protein
MSRRFEGSREKLFGIGYLRYRLFPRSPELPATVSTLAAFVWTDWKF